MSKGNWREFDVPAVTVRSDVSSELDGKAERKVYVQRTKAGKAGKTVTTISGLQLEPDASRMLLKRIKARCGTGGTVKGEVLELQGDQVTLAIEILKGEGYCPKQSGG